MKVNAFNTSDDCLNIMNGIHKKLESLHYHNKVIAVIYGTEIMLNENQVRALQVIAKETGEGSDTEWEDFIRNVKVYSGPTVKGSKHKMIFNRNGTFWNEFDPGFYDVAFKLVMEIL